MGLSIKLDLTPKKYILRGMQTTLSSPQSLKRLLEDIAEVVKEFLKERGLELSDEKTHITHIDDGFDFLGWTNRQI